VVETLIIKDEILIGSRIFRIEFIERLVDGADECYGRYDFADCLIQINSSYSEELQEMALLHELRHIIWTLLGYYNEDKVELGESFIIQQQHYEHQILIQILEWQKGDFQ